MADSAKQAYQAAEPPKDPGEDATPKPVQTPALISQSALYGPADFTRYNPDDLIGRKGFQIYKRMMQDEQIKAAAKFRRNAVTSRGWKITFPEDALSEDEAAMRVRLLEYILSRIPGSFRTSLNYIMLAQWQGFSITEKVYGPLRFEGRPWWGIKSLRKKPFDTFFFDETQYGDLERVWQQAGGRQIDVDRSSVIHYVINPEIDEYYGQSELREAYRSFYAKDILIKLENIYLERMAGGLVWAAQREGASSSLSASDKASLQAVLSNIQTMTGIMMPKDWDLHVESPKGTDAFERAINGHDRKIAKALLMPNLVGLTEAGQTGSYSQSQTQMEGFLWMLDSDAADLAECINEQLIADLCRVNFGDDIYPVFEFNPLSDGQKHTVLGLWKDLVAAKVVTPTETDEAYVRTLLGFPDKAEEVEEPDPTDPNEPGEPDDEEGDPADPPADPNEPPADPAAQAQHQHGDETLMGTGWTEITHNKMRRAFSIAQRRVDFVAIDRSTQTVEYSAEDALGAIMGDLAAHMAEQVRSNEAILTDPAVSNKYKAPPSVAKALKSEGKKLLSDSWALGVDNAQRELRKAGMGRMSAEKFSRFTAIGDIAAKYFDAKAFQMAGSLTDDAVKLFKSTLLNAIKYSWSTDDTIATVYKTFAAKGLITEDQAVEALGDALGIDNPSARLRTVIRTNSFDAINEARFNFFTDAELGGFVQALQYSAILDSRTTQICSTLDDLAMTADRWNELRPPNHFNCRSLLVAVTERDTDVTISDSPPSEVLDGTVKPGEGFGS